MFRLVEGSRDCGDKQIQHNRLKKPKLAGI